MPTLSQVWGCSSDKWNLSRHGAHNLWGKTNQDNNININSLSKWKCKGLRRGSRVPGGWDATGGGEGGFRNIQGCLGQVTHTQFWLPRWLYLIFSHHTPLDLLWLHTAVYVTAHSTGTQLPAPEDTPWPQRVLRAAACPPPAHGGAQQAWRRHSLPHGPHTLLPPFTISQLHREYLKQYQMSFKNVLSVKLFFSKSLQIMHTVTASASRVSHSTLFNSSFGRGTDLFPHITEREPGKQMQPQGFSKLSSRELQFDSQDTYYKGSPRSNQSEKCGKQWPVPSLYKIIFLVTFFCWCNPFLKKPCYRTDMGS